MTQQGHIDKADDLLARATLIAERGPNLDELRAGVTIAGLLAVADLHYRLGGRLART